MQKVAVWSIDAGSEQEVLNDGHYLNLAHVDEQLIELFLVLAVKYQVCSEHEDARSHNRQDLKALKTQNPVEKQEKLVNFKCAAECEHYPVECSLQRRDAQLVHVEAHLRLVHLEQVLKKLAQSSNALRIARYGEQLAQVLAVESSECEVDLVPLVTHVTERCHHKAEMLHRQNTTVGKESAWLLIRSDCNYWNMRFHLE